MNPIPSHVVASWSFQVLVAVLLTVACTAHAETTNIPSIADAGLFEHNPDNNLGGMSFVTAGTTGALAGNDKSRALFRFDVASALPANANITSASVSFNIPAANGAGRLFRLHRILADWGEGTGSGIVLGSGLGSPANPGEVTWNSRFHTAATWTSPGALEGTDFSSTASATATMAASSLVFSSASLVADVQSWLQTPGNNFGWMIRIDNEALSSTASRIATREAGASAPQLSLTYTVPAPAQPLLANVTQTEGNLIFTFDAEAGRTYSVEFRTSPTASSWNVITNIPSQPEPTTHSVTNRISGVEGYFRVGTP